MSLLCIEKLDPRCTLDHLGLIPFFLNPDNPEPAKVQFNNNYQHGGGWRHQSGFKLIPGSFDLQYGDPTEEDADPPMKPIAKVQFREERIFIYEYGYVAIFQPDNSFEICRMD